MIGFGKENDRVKDAPFLIRTIEEEDNKIRFIIALPITGEKGIDIKVMGNQKVNEILSDALPVYPDDSSLYEIVFHDYVFHMTRNESYTTWDDYEIRRGDYFLIFERSRLLDCMPQLVEQEIVEACYPDGCKHYGIYCQNHIIDIISTSKPGVRQICYNN